MYLLAQIDTALKVGADYGIVAFLLISGAAFVGGSVTYWLKRTYGPDGIATKLNECNIESINKNTETLIQLKDLSATQQTLCDRHANRMDQLVQVDAKVDKAVVASEAMANQWANENHNEYRVVPVLDAILKSVDTAEEMSKKCGCDFATEIKVLRTEIIAIKDKIQQGG